MNNQIPHTHFYVYFDTGYTVPEHKEHVHHSIQQEHIQGRMGHLDYTIAATHICNFASLFRNLHTMDSDPMASNPMAKTRFKCPLQWHGRYEQNLVYLHEKLVKLATKIFESITDWPIARAKLARWLAVNDQQAHDVISKMLQYYRSSPQPTAPAIHINNNNNSYPESINNNARYSTYINNNNSSNINNNNNNISHNGSEDCEIMVRPSLNLKPDAQTTRQSLPANFTEFQLLKPKYLLGYHNQNPGMTVFELGARRSASMASRIPLKPFVWQDENRNFVGLIGNNVVYTYELHSLDQIHNLPSAKVTIITASDYVSSACFFSLNGTMHLATVGRGFMSVYSHIVDQRDRPVDQRFRSYWHETLSGSFHQATSVGFGLDNQVVLTEGTNIWIIDVNDGGARKFQHEDGDHNIRDCKVNNQWAIVSNQNNYVVLYKWVTADNDTKKLKVYWRQPTEAITGIGLRNELAYYAENHVVHLLSLIGSEEPFGMKYTTHETDFEITGINATSQHIVMTAADQTLRTIEYN